MKKTKLLLSLFICCILVSCDPADNKFKVINNSNNGIYCFYSCDSIPNNILIQRNIYFSEGEKDSIYSYSKYFVEAKSSFNFKKQGIDAWDQFVKDCNNGVFIFFFVDSVVVNNSDQDLFLKKMYSKRVKYTLDDLEKLNWTVTYP